MKKITLYVEDKVVDTYSNIFTKKCFENFKNVSNDTKIELGLEGMRKAPNIKDNEKEYLLYNAYLNMAVVSEHLVYIKIEDID